MITEMRLKDGFINLYQDASAEKLPSNSSSRQSLPNSMLPELEGSYWDPSIEVTAGGNHLDLGCIGNAIKGSVVYVCPERQVTSPSPPPHQRRGHR
jgi:hypothetical protein